MSVKVAEIRRLGIIRFSGFDDIDDDGEPTEEAGEVNNGYKRRRGGRKRNRRQKIEGTELVKHGSCQGYNLFKSSKLLQEIHDRERIHGMRRDEAKQLLEDKLLFLGDNTLQNVHLRRFCLVVTSDDTFQLADGSKIPAEIVTISMENGKISSILRFFPSKTRSFKMESVENYQGHRMRRVFWNPSVVKDSNMMFRTWSHFLERCLLSLLLVPLNKLPSLLDFLRKINEIRTSQNNRTTVSICLSRVICVEDYLSAIQNVLNTQILMDTTPSMDLVPLHYALDFCRYHLHSMEKVITTLNAYHENPYFYPPPQYFYENRSSDTSSWSYHQQAHISMDPEKYQRILHWLSDLSLTPVDDVEETYDRTMSYEEEDEMFDIETL
ncbi:unnamed protein product [Caenorhabditis brenneri]